MMRFASQLLLLFAIATPLGSCSPRGLIDAGWRWRAESVLWYVETSNIRVALTIDDAPDPQTTAAILDTLRAYGAHATFFVIGEQSRGQEALLERIVREGHELGNHGGLDRPSVSLSRRAFEVDLLTTQKLIAQLQPGGARWFRPGSGYYDQPILRTVERHGLRCVLGDVYAFDAELPSTCLAYFLVRRQIRPGSIVILHDRDARGIRTAKLLGRLLPELRRQGYEVGTLSELVQQIAPVVGSPLD